MRAFFPNVLRVGFVVVLASVSHVEATDAAKKVSWMDSKRKIVGSKKNTTQSSAEILETLNKKKSAASQYLEQITNADCQKIADASLKNIDHIIEIAKKYSKEKGLKKYIRLANEELGSIRFIKKFKFEKIKKDLPAEAAEALLKRMFEVKETLGKQSANPLYTEVLLPNAERQLAALKNVKDKAAKFLGTKILLRKIHGFENSALLGHVK